MQFVNLLEVLAVFMQSIARTFFVTKYYSMILALNAIILTGVVIGAEDGEVFKKVFRLCFLMSLAEANILCLKLLNFHD